MSRRPDRRLDYRRFDLRLVNSCTEAEARELVDRAMSEGGDRVGLLMRRPGYPDPAPGERPQRVFVKAEFRRPHQPLSKRLRSARAYDEGRGYRAFQSAGVPVPEILLFGEQSRWRLRAGAIVATVKLRGENSAELYKGQPDDDLVLDAARALAFVHSRKLTHGDAVLRNYLPFDGRTYILDLPRWGRFTRNRAEFDLALLTGSATKLGMTPDGALATLDAYVRAWPDAVRHHRVGFQGQVLREAAAYHARLAERDRTREGRHERKRKRIQPGERRGD